MVVAAWSWCLQRLWVIMMVSSVSIAASNLRVARPELFSRAVDPSRSVVELVAAANETFVPTALPTSKPSNISAAIMAAANETALPTGLPTSQPSYSVPTFSPTTRWPSSCPSGSPTTSPVWPTSTPTLLPTPTPPPKLVISFMATLGIAIGGGGFIFLVYYCYCRASKNKRKLYAMIEEAKLNIVKKPKNSVTQVQPE